MKAWVIIAVLSLGVFIPAQLVDYYDGGSFCVGLPLSWETDYMGSDPAGADTWLTSRDYWAFPFNYIAVFIAVSIIWLIGRLVKQYVSWWLVEIRRQIRYEMQIRRKRAGR